MKAEKTYVIHHYYARSSRDYYVKGTVAQLTDYFGYTLTCGNSWNPRIPTKPKTAKSLVSALNKSVYETQGSCYNQDYYELVDSAPEGSEHFNDLTKEDA